MMVLLDPEILLPLDRNWNDDGYWLLLSDWASDRRVRVGLETQRFGHALFAEIDYPAIHAQDKMRPRPVAKDIYRLLNQLLSRVANSAADEPPRTPNIQPHRVANADATKALAIDLAGLGSTVTALATVTRAWRPPPATEASCDPPPPDHIDLIFGPNAEIPHETSAELEKHLSGKRVRVVGGRRHTQAVAQLLKMGVKEVDWLECERRKSAKPDERWAGIGPERDVCVIVTGRIGHAVSDSAEQACRRAGVDPLRVKEPQHVADAVLTQAMRGL